MSEVKADGVLLNPEESLLQLVQHKSNALMAGRPQGMEDRESRTEPVCAANGAPAGQVGRTGHMPPDLRARHKGIAYPACRDRE